MNEAALLIDANTKFSVVLDMRRPQNQLRHLRVNKFVLSRSQPFHVEEVLLLEKGDDHD